MRTKYSDSSGRNNSRYPKRQNGGGGGGRRPQGSNSGRRNPGQHGNGSVNISAMTSTRNKYLEMAKEALANGNRVEAENYYQHAEHYSKMLSAAMATRREREEVSDTNNNSDNNSGNGGNGNGGGHYNEKPNHNVVADKDIKDVEDVTTQQNVV